MPLNEKLAAFLAKSGLSRVVVESVSIKLRVRELPVGPLASLGSKDDGFVGSILLMVFFHHFIRHGLYIGNTYALHTFAIKIIA